MGKWGGGAPAQQTAAQLDSFANSERRGGDGGFGILAPARPAPGLAGRRNPAPGARGHPLALRVPGSGAHLGLGQPAPPSADPRARQLFPAPPPPRSSAPSPSSPNPATSAAAATHAVWRAKRPAGLGAHSRLQTRASPPRPGARSSYPRLQRNFPRAPRLAAASGLVSPAPGARSPGRRPLTRAANTYA